MQIQRQPDNQTTRMKTTLPMKMLKDKYPNVVSSDEDDEEDEDDGFEDCEYCGYTHHYEDKCPNEATAHHYDKWREDEEDEDDEDDDASCCEDVDDRDAPNIYPYKKCSDCGERKSCGLYDDDNKWFCEDCFPAPQSA